MSSSEAVSSTASASFATRYVWPFLYRSGQVVVAILAVAAGLLYVQQESLLYFPTVGNLPRSNADNPRGYRHPGERGLTNYSSHIIASREDGVEIHAWFIPHPSSTSKSSDSNSKPLPTILFFHGNAGNIGLRIPNAVEFVRHVRANLMLVEYRGYGDSPGVNVKPSEPGLKRDAVAAWEYCRTQLAAQEPRLVDPNQVYVFGRSLGGAVAIHLTAHAEAQGTPLQGCLLENTFTSISDMVDHLLPFLSPIKRFVLRIGWNSFDILKQGQIQKTPLLFLAGDADTLVPHEHMLQLRDAAHLALMPHGLTPSWHAIKGGTHNKSWLQGGRPYWQAISDFILQTSPSKAATSATSFGIDGSIAGSSSSSSAIPLMSNQFVGMARDAWNNGSVTAGGKNKTN